MKKTYTYNPSRINDKGLNQMRFELGDTLTEGGEDTSILSDEEYNAIIFETNSKKTWRDLKVQCLKGIVMKLSYEVDYSVGDMSLKLSKRCANFKDMLQDMEKPHQTPIIVSEGMTESFGKRSYGGENYFYFGMQENKRAI